MKNKIIIVISSIVVIAALFFVGYNLFSKNGYINRKSIEEKPAESAEYKDLYKSNIEVDIGEIDLNPDDYAWFTIPEGTDMAYYGIYQFIIYGINTYYSGNVPGTFTCAMPDDIFNETTNMIFEVHVHGSEQDVDMAIDTYNYNIVITPIEN